MKNHDSVQSNVFDPARPNGEYVLDLSSASEYTVANELLALRQDHGPKSWKNVKLDDSHLWVKKGDPLLSPPARTLLNIFETSALDRVCFRILFVCHRFRRNGPYRQKGFYL